jgi:CO/xanthine dehydrogenase Mo-binding subunit
VAAYANNRLSWGKNDSSDSNSNPDNGGSGASTGTGSASVTAQAAAAPANKKLELWKRRWARAEHIMRREGVVLRRWRVGQDIVLDAVRLVEKNLREMGVVGFGVGMGGVLGMTGLGGGEVKVKDLK